MTKREMIVSMKYAIMDLEEYLEKLNTLIHKNRYRLYPTDLYIKEVKLIDTSIDETLHTIQRLLGMYIDAYSKPDNSVVISPRINTIIYQLKHFKGTYRLDGVDFTVIEYDIDSIQFDLVTFIIDIDYLLGDCISEYKNNRQGYDFDSPYIKFEVAYSFDDVYTSLSERDDIKLIIRYKKQSETYRYGTIEFLYIDHNDVLNFLLFITRGQVRMNRVKLYELINNKNRKVSGMYEIDFAEPDSHYRYLSVIFNMPTSKLYENKYSSPILISPFNREIYGKPISYFNPKEYLERQRKILEMKEYEEQQRKLIEKEMINKRDFPDDVKKFDELFDGICSIRKCGNDFEFTMTLISSRYTYESILDILNKHREYVGLKAYEKFAETINKRKAYKDLDHRYFKPVSIVLTKDRRLVVMYSLKIDIIPEIEYTLRDKKNA